jgi:arsenite methyltransferase
MQWWVVSSRAIGVSDPVMAASTRGISYFSETVRAFKVAGLEDSPENYGQHAVYNGSLPGFPHAFPLGLGCVFITGQRTPVDSNTARILSNTRYAAAFRVSAPGAHRGPFQAGGSIGTAVSSSAPVADTEASVSCCPPPPRAAASDGTVSGASECSSSKCC